MTEDGLLDHPDWGDENPKPWHGLGAKLADAKDIPTAEEAKWTDSRLQSEVDKLLDLALKGDKAAGVRASRLAKRLLRRHAHA